MKVSVTRGKESNVGVKWIGAVIISGICAAAGKDIYYGIKAVVQEWWLKWKGERNEHIVSE